MNNASIEEVLNHPVWQMGKKISVDSATMMNKGLEVIEAAYLFNIKINKIDVVIHPQSLIHGMVNYSDGSTISYISPSDMKIPISFSLSYLTKTNHYQRDNVNFSTIKEMSFFAPNDEKFPLLKIARQSFSSGPSAVITLNAANEQAVSMFLEGRIKFRTIVPIITEIMNKYYLDNGIKNTETIEDVLLLHEETIKKTSYLAKDYQE